MPRVIAEIRLGLGNQMFQYAFGRWLARRLGRELWLDIQWFRDGNRRLGLLDYAIKARQLTRLQSFTNRFPGRIECVDEVEVSKAEEIDSDKDIFLRGFWQDYRWPQAVLHLLRDDLQLLKPPSEAARQWIARCREEPVIALHIRRGDYLLPRHRARYPQLDNAWYRTALGRLDGETRDWPLLIFSDDPDWVKNSFNPGRGFELVSGSGPMSDIDEFEILRHASACVLAPSTFGWWAATLSVVEGPTVVAPPQWNLENPRLVQHLLPPSWLTVPVGGADG